MISRVLTHCINADAGELSRSLEARIGSREARHGSIARIDCRPCPYTSSFQIDEIDVVFDDGFEIALILKHLSSGAMLPEARRVRPEFLYEPEREIEAYRSVLPFGPAGTALSYGAWTSPDADRYWLFLERVEGLELRHVGAFSMWEETARWIARFHRSFP